MAATTTTRTQLATNGDDHVAQQRRDFQNLLKKEHRYALADAHAAILAAREEQPKRRWWQKRKNTTDLRSGLTFAAELVAAKLAGVDKT